MKKSIIIICSVAFLTFTAFTLAKPTVMKGDAAFLKESNSIYVEFDMSTTTLDGLESEEEFVAYKKKKAKDPEKWEQGWEKDKKNFGNYYIEALKRKCKKLPCSFNDDDPESDYKVVVKPVHLETGNPIKKSSVEVKMHFYKNGEETEAAVIHIPKTYGVQQGPMSATVGQRMVITFNNSALVFAKFYKKYNKN